MIAAIATMAILGCPAKASPDHRAYCYAHQFSSPRYCQTIKAPRLRQQCHLELGPRYQHCIKINDGLGRYLCRRARTTTGL